MIRSFASGLAWTVLVFLAGCLNAAGPDEPSDPTGPPPDGDAQREGLSHQWDQDDAAALWLAILVAGAPDGEIDVHYEVTAHAEQPTGSCETFGAFIPDGENWTRMMAAGVPGESNRVTVRDGDPSDPPTVDEYVFEGSANAKVHLTMPTSRPMWVLLGNSGAPHVRQDLRVSSTEPLTVQREVRGPLHCVPTLEDFQGGSLTVVGRTTKAEGMRADVNVAGAGIAAIPRQADTRMAFTATCGGETMLTVDRGPGSSVEQGPPMPQWPPGQCQVAVEEMIGTTGARLGVVVLDVQSPELQTVFMGHPWPPTPSSPKPQP